MATTDRLLDKPNCIIRQCTYEYRIVTMKRDSRRVFAPSVIHYDRDGKITHGERVVINEVSVEKVHHILKQLTTACKKPILDLEKGYEVWKRRTK